MNTSFNFSQLSFDNIMVGVIAALLIVVALMLQWPVIKNKLRERKLMRVIRKFGRETLHDVMLPDGLDDFTYIEHLVLTANAIVVLYLKRYRGVIFAGERIDEWTQVLNNHSYRFPNPLQKVEMDIMAIRNLVPATEVQGLIVFTQGSEFPKGKPDNVMLFSELEAQLKDFKAGELPPALHTAWKKLAEQAQPCSKEFISRMREDDSQQGHGVLASMFILAALIWLGWHFI
ncbi:MAG: nuclease-related domain-containing protein [Thioalkalispiraceae bacterium]|jgi:hypothetical protein